MLHGRNEKKLNSVRDELLKLWPKRQIRLLVFDAMNEATNVTKLGATVQELRDIDLRVLVNNVGGGGSLKPAWQPLAESDDKRTSQFIHLNALFSAEITRLLLPQLIQKPSSLILNVGSIAGEAPGPYVSLYSGSKAFNKAWSRSLDLEMRAERNDVEVKLILVGMVSSGSAARELSFFTTSSRRMARDSLDKVGCRESVVWGYWPHALQAHALSCLPTWLLEREVLKVALAEKTKEEKEMKAI